MMCARKYARYISSLIVSQSPWTGKDIECCHMNFNAQQSNKEQSTINKEAFVKFKYYFNMHLEDF